MDTKYNWKEKREKKAFLALADGTVYRGHSVGALKDCLGEVVFNTGMTGYQEILSDPSYSGQIVTMTYTEMGNYGVSMQDMESRTCFANGFIVHHMNEPSSWRSEQSLHDFLIRNSIPAIAGIDTRALTSKLRDTGTLRGYISVEQKVGVDEAIKNAKQWIGLDGQDYACRVSCAAPYEWDPDGKLTDTWGIAAELPPADLKIVAYDFGIKWNILRRMRLAGMNVTVVPAQTPADKVLAMKPDGVFYSNGPADPAAVTYAIDTMKTMIGKIPVMGICLGHQIMGIALGGKTYRLKFGHHGCNQPVKDLKTGKVEITSQNHNFAVAINSLDRSKIEVTHINLNDQTAEGIEHKTEPMFSIQYHPEAAPGPHDSSYLFGRFRELIAKA
jgi:carbamoyl-phosphate synthase small subunit